jgi:hypothetical protein
MRGFDGLGNPVLNDVVREIAAIFAIVPGTSVPISPRTV